MRQDQIRNLGLCAKIITAFNASLLTHSQTRTLLQVVKLQWGEKKKKVPTSAKFDKRKFLLTKRRKYMRVYICYTCRGVVCIDIHILPTFMPLSPPEVELLCSWAEHGAVGLSPGSDATGGTVFSNSALQKPETSGMHGLLSFLKAKPLFQHSEAKLPCLWVY